MRQKRTYSIIQRFLVDICLFLLVALAFLPVCVRIWSLRTAGTAEAMQAIVAQNLSAFWQDLPRMQDTLAQQAEPVTPVGEAVPRTEAAPEALVSLQQTLSNAIHSKDLVDVFLYVPTSGALITQYRVYESADALLSDYTLDGEDLHTILAALDAAPEPGFWAVRRLRGANTLPTYTAFCYAMPVDLPALGKPAVALLFYDRNAFLHSVFPRRAFGAKWLSVSWQDTQLTYHRGKWVSGPMTTLRVEDAASGLIAEMQLPPDFFARLLTSTGTMATVTWIALLALCPLIAAAISGNHLRPLRHMLASDPAPRRVRERIRAVITGYDEIEDRVTEYRARLRTISIERLLRAKDLTDAECRKISANIGAFPERFIVGYGAAEGAEPTGLDDAHQTRVVMALGRLAQQLPRQSILQNLGNRHFAVIVPSEPNPERTVRGIRRTLSGLNQGQDIKLRISFGAPCTSMLEVNGALEYARMLFAEDEAFPIGHGEQALPASFANILDRYHRSLVAGDHVMAAESVRQFSQACGRAVGISLEQQYYTLKTILQMACAESGCPQSVLADLEGYQLSQAPDDLIDAVIRTGNAVCDTIHAKSADKDASRRSALLKYVETHYTDPNFYVGSLAQAFALSEKYIYSVFKEKTGVSPASYILRLRLQHAARLLAETELPVQQVSEEAGFATISAYNKAFKKYYGMTSSQYRERVYTMPPEGGVRDPLVLEDDEKV